MIELIALVGALAAAFVAGVLVGRKNPKHVEAAVTEAKKVESYVAPVLAKVEAVAAPKA